MLNCESCDYYTKAAGKAGGHCAFVERPVRMRELEGDAHPCAGVSFDQYLARLARERVAAEPLPKAI